MEMPMEENLSFRENSEDIDLYENANQETCQQQDKEKSFLHSQTAETQIINEEKQTAVLKNQEQPLYRLNNIQTEMYINTEIKELICTRVSEELNAATLNNMNDGIENHVGTLRTLISNQQTKNERLKKELEIDEKRLAQTEQILLRTNEIIELLEENLEKVKVMYGESGINRLLENSLKQRESWESSKKRYVSKMNEEKKCLVDEESRNTNLIKSMKKELDEKKELLESLKMREDEFKKTIRFYDDEIERILCKKDKLERSVDANFQKKLLMEKELAEQNDLEKLTATTDVQNTKLNEMEKKKTQMEENLKVLTLELEDATKTVSLFQDQILEKQETLVTLKETLHLQSEKHRQSVEKLQQELENISSKLEEVEKQNANSRSIIEKLLSERDTFKSNYIKKCEQEIELMNRNLKQQNRFHEAKMDLLKKQSANDIERAKFAELENHYETSLKTLNSLEENIAKERERISMEVMQTRLKFNEAQTDFIKFTSDMKNKKDYLQENSACLQEKCENLKHQISDYEKKNAELREKNLSIESLVQNKVSHLEELKSKLDALKKGGPLKSVMKSPKSENVAKKVKFNEVLSFRSPSSSEVSTIPNENLSQLSNAFMAFLRSGSPSDKELVEKEF